MGESWSDLDAMEYQFENGFDTGAGPYVIGAYATGNPTVGIRDYALDSNPLNYSDLGFDTPGPEVHADGEIWNGTNFEVRQALIDKYNATYPVGDAARQKACADGKYAADACPGNRRWIQIVYDAFLLQQSTTSMLDARDAYLAADMMRFGGANQTELWHAFAKRGMGTGASSAGNGDDRRDAELRLAQRGERDDHLQRDRSQRGQCSGREREGLRRPLRGPRDADRGHGCGHGALGDGEARRRDVRLRRAGARIRPVPVQPDVHGRPDRDGQRGDADELGVVRQGRDGSRRRHATPAT